MRDFVLLPDSRRRELLQEALSAGLRDDPNLTDEQYDERVGERYEDVMEVCGGFPDLHIDLKFKGVTPCLLSECICILLRLFVCQSVFMSVLSSVCLSLCL